MNRYLIDTDVLIDHLRGHEPATAYLREIASRRSHVYYSVITKAEIYAGIRPEEEDAVALLFESMAEVHVDGGIALTGGRYRNRFRASHGLLLPDALIAASARSVDAVLVTLDRGHYPMDDIAIRVPYNKDSSVNRSRSSDTSS